MASRLYRTTRRLYAQVAFVLARLGIGQTCSPTTAALVGLYVTGLILLDVRQTQTRLTRFLPARCHEPPPAPLKACPPHLRVTA